MENKFKKGDVVRIIRGTWKKFIGEFIYIDFSVNNNKGMPLINIWDEMYDRTLPMYLPPDTFEKFNPKCSNCEKVFNGDIEQIKLWEIDGLPNSWLCDVCYKKK